MNQKRRKNNRVIRHTAAMALMAGLLWASDGLAHKTRQARIVHIVLHGQRVELYVNFLLPRGAKSRLWLTLFDRNRNRKLEPKEQQALGGYLSRLVTRGLHLTHKGTPLKLTLKEWRNSQHRGDPRKRRYSWDYRLQTQLRPGKGKQALHFSARLLFQKEQLPVAVVGLKPWHLIRTKTSYVLQRNGVDRSVCQLNQKRTLCRFALHNKRTRPRAQPTTRATVPKH